MSKFFKFVCQLHIVNTKNSFVKLTKFLTRITNEEVQLQFLLKRRMYDTLVERISEKATMFNSINAHSNDVRKRISDLSKYVQKKILNRQISHSNKHLKFLHKELELIKSELEDETDKLLVNTFTNFYQGTLHVIIFANQTYNLDIFDTQTPTEQNSRGNRSANDFRNKIGTSECKC